MSEIKTKKNPDYKDSAFKLNNNEIVKTELEKYHEAIKDLEAVKSMMENTPEWKAYQSATEKVNTQKTIIQEAIVLHGSYQDVENGIYALQQRRVSKLYNAATFEVCYPELAPAVLDKVINVKALEALIKSGRISEDSLRRGGVLTEGETFAFIIK